MIGPSAAGEQVRLVTYNIQYSLGRDGRYDLARCLAAVAEADIIALQEVERFWERTGMSNKATAIAGLLPDRFWVYGAPFDIDASIRRADGRIENRRRQFGQMLLSRWPIQSSRLFVLPKEDTGDEFNMVTGAVEAIVDHPAGALRIYSVHLGHLGPEERLAQVARLRRLIREAPSEGGVWSGVDGEDLDHWSERLPPPPMPEEAILLGDFNMDPGSAEYLALVAPYEWHEERSEEPAFVDAWAAAGTSRDDGITFPGDGLGTPLPPQRIDYCFLTPKLTGTIQTCRVDSEAEGSDHQPVWVELRL
jgi:endonuclease/exonuclease/phosphatase family metal-dependent hydrolase